MGNVGTSLPINYTAGTTYVSSNGDTSERNGGMGILDSIKGLFGGNKNKIKDGIDSAAGMASGVAGGHADKVDKAADMAKDAVDKLPE